MLRSFTTTTSSQVIREKVRGVHFKTLELLRRSSALVTTERLCATSPQERRFAASATFRLQNTAPWAIRFYSIQEPTT